jgi:hypothetical protein
LQLLFGDGRASERFDSPQPSILEQPPLSASIVAKQNVSQ